MKNEITTYFVIYGIFDTIEVIKQIDIPYDEICEEHGIINIYYNKKKTVDVDLGELLRDVISPFLNKIDLLKKFREECDYIGFRIVQYGYIYLNEGKEEKNISSDIMNFMNVTGTHHIYDPHLFTDD